MIKDATLLGYCNSPANNVTEDKPLDLSALPPPDHGEGDEFTENDLMDIDTVVKYHNPPEAKFSSKA